MANQPIPHLSDLELVSIIRDHAETSTEQQPESDAFAELWTRHYAAGYRAACQMTHRFDAEDLTQEAFVRIVTAIKNNHGPTEAFRPYLYMTIRSISMIWAREESHTGVTLDEADTLIDPESMFADKVLERTVTGQAFNALRPEWRTVLWYAEVEGMKPREIAVFLGVTANAVSALAVRARDGLRSAWMQAHLNTEAADPGCQETVAQLGAYNRGKLTRHARDHVQEHLTGCMKCSILVDELDNAASRLGIMLLPVILGPGITRLGLPLAQGATVGGVSAATTTPIASVSGIAVPLVAHSAAAGQVFSATAATAATAAGMSTAAVITGVSSVAVVAALGAVIAIGSLSHAEPTDGGPSGGGVPPTASSRQLPAVGAPPLSDLDSTPLPEKLTTHPSEPPVHAPPQIYPPTLPDHADQVPAVGTNTPDYPILPPHATAPSPSPTGPVVVGPPQPSATPEPSLEPSPGPSPEPSASVTPSPDPEPVIPVTPQIIGSDGETFYLPTLHGTAVPGSTLILMQAGTTTELARTVVSSAGTWSLLATPPDNVAEFSVVAQSVSVDDRPSAISEPIGPFTPATPNVVGDGWFRPFPTAVITGVLGNDIEVIVNGVPSGDLYRVTYPSLVLWFPQFAHGDFTAGFRYVDPSPNSVGRIMTRTYIDGRLVTDPNDIPPAS